VVKTNDPNISISIRDDNGTRQYLNQEPCIKGELALGIMFSPYGSMEDEV
jgi:hypothetical protein